MDMYPPSSAGQGRASSGAAAERGGRRGDQFGPFLRQIVPGTCYTPDLQVVGVPLVTVQRCGGHEWVTGAVEHQRWHGEPVGPVPPEQVRDDLVVGVLVHQRFVGPGVSW